MGLKVRRHTRQAQGIFWWVKATSRGRPVLLGPFNSSSEAYSIGYDKLEEDFDVVTLPTADVARASRLVKADRLCKEDTPLPDALKRMKHKVGVRKGEQG